MNVVRGYDGFDRVSCLITGYIFINLEYQFRVYGQGPKQHDTHIADMKLDSHVCEYLLARLHILLVVRLNQMHCRLYDDIWDHRSTLSPRKV